MTISSARTSACRVVVIGGGPAGSTAATLLARFGATVTVLEREYFPRYHVGESIAPSCRAIIDYLGVEEKIAARAYTVKRGVLLRWGAEKDWAVNWQEMFGEDIRSWQVERSDFDQVLLDHSRTEGARIVEGAHVKKVVMNDAGRAVAVEWVHDGTVHREVVDFVVDASGRAGLICAQQLDNRVHHETFRNVAIWGYFKGGSLLPDTPSGGIDVISTPQGWWWVIPQKDDVYSVGFVTHKHIFQQRRPDYESVQEMYQALLAECDTVAQLTAEGSFTGPVRVESDYSYVAESFCGPGYFVAGDAACFLDPLLSTGVHLGMFSGMLAAAAITSIAHDEVQESEAAEFYETLYRNAYHRMFALVAGMYRKYQGRTNYFWMAQNLLRATDDTTEQNAFGAIVAGLSDLKDAQATSSIAPARGLRETAGLAHELLTAELAEQTETTTAPMKMDPNDLFDVDSGLYLTLEPRLGIGRRARVVAAQPFARSTETTP